MSSSNFAYATCVESPLRQLSQALAPLPCRTLAPTVSRQNVLDSSGDHEACPGEVLKVDYIIYGSTHPASPDSSSVRISRGSLRNLPGPNRRRAQSSDSALSPAHCSRAGPSPPTAARCPGSRRPLFAPGGCRDHVPPWAIAHREPLRGAACRHPAPVGAAAEFTTLGIRHSCEVGKFLKPGGSLPPPRLGRRSPKTTPTWPDAPSAVS